MIIAGLSSKPPSTHPNVERQIRRADTQKYQTVTDLQMPKIPNHRTKTGGSQQHDAFKTLTKTGQSCRRTPTFELEKPSRHTEALSRRRTRPAPRSRHSAKILVHNDCVCGSHELHRSHDELLSFSKLLLGTTVSRSAAPHRTSIRTGPTTSERAGGAAR